MLSRRNDGGRQRLQIPRSIVPNAVDEKRRCAVNATANPALKIFLHPGGKFMLFQISLESLYVQPNFRGVSQQRTIIEMTLMLEKIIVHLPELPLRPGRF